MGDSGSERVADKVTEVYRLSLAQVLSAGTFLVLVLGFFLNSTRSTNTDITATVERSETKLRAEFQLADNQLREEIGKSETRSSEQIKAVEARNTTRLDSNERRDSKRFETIETRIDTLSKGKR